LAPISAVGGVAGQAAEKDPSAALPRSRGAAAYDQYLAPRIARRHLGLLSSLGDAFFSILQLARGRDGFAAKNLKRSEAWKAPLACAPIPPARIAPHAGRSRGRDRATAGEIVVERFDSALGEPGRAPTALVDLVKTEDVKRATLWTTPELAAWEVAGTLKALGVEIVPAQADKHLVAACELGVTGVDAALAETGTLQLLSSPERPRVVSLLPRVHLAIFTPTVLGRPARRFRRWDAGYSVTDRPTHERHQLTLTLACTDQSLYAWVLTGYEERAIAQAAERTVIG
jgi:hypothetical protein